MQTPSSVATFFFEINLNLVGPKIHIAHGSWNKSKMLYNWQEEKENKKQLVNTDDLSV